MQSSVRISGISPPVRLHAISTKTIDGLERGVKERVLFVPKKNGTFASVPLPKPGFFKASLLESVKLLRRYLPSTVPMSYDKFLETTRSCKKRSTEKAIESLLVTGLDGRDYDIDIFGKYEKTNFTKKVNPAARVISYRGARFCVVYGCFIRPIEHYILSKSITKLFGEKTVFKGLNTLQSGRLLHEKWSRYPNPIAIGIDAVKYDEHMHTCALRVAHALYGHCFPHVVHKRELQKLCLKQLHNTCRAYSDDGKLKYRVDGQTMSGEMSTSLTACVIMCLMLHTYFNLRGVTASLANNGDDCVVIMDAKDEVVFRTGFDEWFLTMGFEMTVEPTVTVFEKIQFCQTNPIFLGPGPDDYIMCRDPFVGIAKDTVMLDRWTTPKVFRGWLDCVGKGGLACTAGLPVFPSFYKCYIKHGSELPKYTSQRGPALNWSMRQSLKTLVLIDRKPTPQTRASFYYAFDVTPVEQVIMEEFYDQCLISTDFDVNYENFLFQPSLPLGCLDAGPCPWDSYDNALNVIDHTRFVTGMVLT